MQASTPAYDQSTMPTILYTEEDFSRLSYPVGRVGLYAKKARGGNVMLPLTIAIVSSALAAAVTDWDVTHWTGYITLLIVSATGIVTAFVAASIKIIGEIRKLIAALKNMPTEVKSQVGKALDDSPLPTTQHQVNEFGKNIAAEVVKQIDNPPPAK